MSAVIPSLLNRLQLTFDQNKTITTLSYVNMTTDIVKKLNGVKTKRRKQKLAGETQKGNNHKTYKNR
jgi:hypothetical protein